MTRTAPIVMAVLLVIGGISALPIAAAAQSGSSTVATVGGAMHAQIDENASETASNVTPGERLSGVVGVGQAEFEGEIELRAYGLEFASAATDNAKADVVADRLERTEERLAELKQQRDELEEARENGEISEGEYNARAAELAARTETVKQMADASEARAGSLPEDVLVENGVNVTAIQKLKTSAEELTGPQVAAIAKTIAGDDVGRSVSAGPPEEIGVPSPDQARDGVGDRGADDAGAAIDRADEQLNATEMRLAEVEEQLGDDADENATEALEQAYAELERARQALQDARDAIDNGNQEEAREHAEDALNHAQQADEHAQEALEATKQSGQSGADGDAGQGDDQHDAGQ